MIRSRVLLSAALLSLLLAHANTVFGLGLGELQLNSALNQNFSAEIELSNTEGLAPEEILPVLARQKDFDRYGVERSYLLTDLRFSIRTRSGGGYYIEVVSTRPIQEPFLNFIIEVLWPNGKILREFTVLLDPPVFGDAGVAPIAPATSSPGTRSKPAPPRPSTTKSVPAASPSSPMTEGEIVDKEYGVTGPGDTLWQIALKVRPNESVTVQQTMLALQRMNPDAFINNNINLLKAGHVLRIPAVGDIKGETRTGAVAEVRAQNIEFQDYKSSGVAQMDATRRQRAAPRTDDAGEQGELKLLAANRATGQRAGDSDARVSDLENELAIAREDLDRTRRGNSELNVRLDDLSAQIETLNELLKVKDDQMAAWRAELQKAQAAGGAAPGAEPSPAAPAAVEQGSLLTNPIVLVVLLVLVIGGIVAGMIFMRKRKEDPGTIEEDFAEVSVDEPLAVEEAPSEEQEDAAEVDEEADEDLSQQTEDVLSEAEIYIAYGRFPQAITFLQNAVEAEPDRADIQLKLMEVFVQTEDATAFNLQFDQLKMLGDDAAVEAAMALQAQIPGAAETAQAAMDATIVSSEPIEAITEIDDDDDDLSFDLDDLDAETDDDDELDLGGELDLDEEEDLDLDLDLEADDESDLELGDTELDIDLDADDTLALDEEDLDLDLDLEDDGGIELKDDDLDLGGDDEISLDDDDGAISLDLDADDDFNLEEELGSDDELAFDDDDDAISLDLDAVDDFNLEDDLNLEAEEEPALEDDDAISLDVGDDVIDLDLGDDEISLDLDDDEISLDLDDDEISLDLDDDEISLDLDDDDLGELNLDEDGSSKLDLARAYIDMGDSDGARTLLNEVVTEGLDSEIQEANELLEKLD